MYSQLLPSTKFVSGMLRTVNNSSEFKSQGFNAIAFSLCMMENRSFQVGVMVKSELSYLNLVNCFTSSMMLTTTDAQQLQQLQMEPESFQAVPKVKLESGKSQSKLKLWKLHLKNTGAEFGPFKSTKIILKQYQPAVTAHASFGTSRPIQDFSVFFNQQLLNRPCSTLKNTKSLLPAQTEKSLTGKNTMGPSSDQ